MDEIGLVAHDPDAELIATTTEPIARSPAAERMRRHRERRLIIFTVAGIGWKHELPCDVVAPPRYPANNAIVRW